MTDQSIQLADRFVAEQDIAPERALEIATKILSSDDAVAEAAVLWCTTGAMPAAPVIEGHSPEELYEKYFPTQVFTILRGLAHDPGLISSLKRLPQRNSGRTKPGEIPVRF